MAFSLFSPCCFWQFAQVPTRFQELLERFMTRPKQSKSHKRWSFIALSLTSLLHIFFCQCKLWARHRHILNLVFSASSYFAITSGTSLSAYFHCKIFLLPTQALNGTFLVLSFISYRPIQSPISRIYSAGITSLSSITYSSAYSRGSLSKFKSVSPYLIAIHSRTTLLTSSWGSRL